MSAIIQDPSFVFDAESHRYTLDGVELPSVTHILDGAFQEYANIPPEVLRRAQERGTAAHKACELHDLGTLDYETLDPMIAPYLEGYIKFLSDTGFELHAIELPAYNKKYWYAGTMDRLGTPKRAKRRWLVDIKTPTTVSRTAGPQTAAYEQIARERSWIGEKEKIDRYALQLRDDGSYRLLPFGSPYDFSVFLSALTIHKFKRGV